MASTSGPVVSALRHGGTPSISISIVKLSTVRIRTIIPRTAASVSDGVDVTVFTMSAATSSSRPRRIAPPSDSRNVLNARPPLLVRFQVTIDSANAKTKPDDHRQNAQHLERLRRPLEELFSSHAASAPSWGDRFVPRLYRTSARDGHNGSR